MAKVDGSKTPAGDSEKVEALPKLTRFLLACGVIAGPLYVVTGLVEALTRPGFDITRHDLSLLSNGSLGWIQISNFLVSGLLTIAGAIGMRRVLRTGRGASWGPLLIGAYGFGLIGAACFAADPAFGFPPGTPAGANAITWHGALHFICAGLGFVSLIVATFIFARRFASLGRRGWAAYSAATGTIFLAAFLGVAAGRPIAVDLGLSPAWTVLGLWAGVIAAWIWISAIAARGVEIR